MDKRFSLVPEDQEELDLYEADNAPALEDKEYLRQQQVAYTDTGVPVGPEGGFRAGQAKQPVVGKAAADKYFASNDANTPTLEPVDTKVADTNDKETNAQRYQRMLSELEDLRSQPKPDLTMLRGGNQIAQAIASGYGGKLGDNNDVVTIMENKDDDRVKNLLSELKLMKDTTGAIRPSQQSNIFGKLPDGKMVPLIFDPNIQKYVNPLNGEPAGPNMEIMRNSLYTDAFGNKVSFGTDGVQTQKSSARPEASQTVDNIYAQTQTFNPDKEQVKALDQETKRLDSATKDINAKIDATNRLRSTLASNSKLTGAMVKTQFPRLAGEVGNLNQAEQDVWNGSSAWLDRIDQFLTTASDSQLTPENKVELNKLIDIFNDTSGKALNQIMDSSANRLNMVHKIPKDFVKQSYGSMRKIPQQTAGGTNAEVQKANAATLIKKFDDALKQNLTPEVRAAYEKKKQELKDKFGL